MRYESVIHEFDPYFNFRTTKFLATEGFLDFLNWFDDRGWYPLGRTIGGTIYPGLMATAASFYWILHALHITINIRNMCVFEWGSKEGRRRGGWERKSERREKWVGRGKEGRRSRGVER